MDTLLPLKRRSQRFLRTKSYYVMRVLNIWPTTLSSTEIIRRKGIDLHTTKWYAALVAQVQKTEKPIYRFRHSKAWKAIKSWLPILFWGAVILVVGIAWVALVLGLFVAFGLAAAIFGGFGSGIDHVSNDRRPWY